MNITQSSNELSSHPATTGKLPYTPPTSSKTSSTSSLRTSLSQLSPILTQGGPYPIFRTPSTPRTTPSPPSTSTSKREPISSSRWLRLPLNGGSLRGESIPHNPHLLHPPRHIGTAVLRRTVSERAPRPDSGVVLERDATNGLYTAKVSARAMERAMRNENVLQRPVPTQMPKWGEWVERGGCTMERTVERARRNGETERKSNYYLGSLAQVEVEGQRGRAMARCPSTVKRRNTSINHERKQNLASLPPTTNLDSKRNSSKETPKFTPLSSLRHTDDAALQFRAIENADERTQNMILEGQICRITKAVMPPLQEGPGKDVEFVVWTGRRDREEVGRMGDVGAEVEMEMEMENEEKAKRKKDRRWGKIVGSIRGFCARRSRGREVRSWRGLGWV